MVQECYYLVINSVNGHAVGAAQNMAQADSLCAEAMRTTGKPFEVVVAIPRKDTMVDAEFTEVNG